MSWQRQYDRRFRAITKRIASAPNAPAKQKALQDLAKLKRWGCALKLNWNQ